jgi:hypothetical protein
MKIVDSTMFYNEFDILELRLRIMYDHVDRFVITESDYTHSGKYKGFRLEEHKERYLPWWDKICYIKGNMPQHLTNAWDREHWQRDLMSQGWEDVSGNDVILVSDLDEIIRPDTLQFIRSTDYGYYGLYMPAFYFKFNYLDTKQDWHYKVWGRAYRGFKTSPQHMRLIGVGETPGKHIKLHHAGWHFGWLGDNNFVKTKLQSFAHTEWDTPEILNNINIDRHITEGRDHVRPENVTWVPVSLDDYFPKEIVDNKEKYSSLILPDSGKSVRDYWPKQILETE